MTREELIEAILESTASEAAFLALQLRKGTGGAHRMKVSSNNLPAALDLARKGTKEDLLKFVRSQKDKTNIYIPFKGRK